VHIDPQAWFIPALQIAVACILCLILLARQGDSLGEATLCGAVVLAALLLLARWSTSPYFTFDGTMFIAAFLCLPFSNNDSGSGSLSGRYADASSEESAAAPVKIAPR
jgi:hypothetical protein